MSIALYNNIAIVVAYVVCEVAGVVMEVFGTSGDVTDCAVKAEVVIDVTVADETLVVFNIVGLVLIFVISVVFEAVEVIDAQFKLVILKSVVLMFNLFPVLSVTVSTGVETVDALPLDAVLVLSFLVVFTVNGAFIVGY